MKLFVFLREDDFEIFLSLTNLPNSPETFQRFLKTVGTTQIAFSQKNEFFFSVPPGSCVRLRTEDDYIDAIHTLLPRDKEDKSRRSSSCTIV
jgi:hypothetical protein